MNRITYIWLLVLLNLTALAAPLGAADGVPVARKVAAPTGLVADAGDAHVSVTWRPADGAASYTVYRRTVATGETVRVASGITALTFVDKDVVNGTVYRYWVRASSGSIVSAPSVEAAARPEPVRNAEVALPSPSLGLPSVPVAPAAPADTAKPAPAAARDDSRNAEQASAAQPTAQTAPTSKPAAVAAPAAPSALMMSMPVAAAPVPASVPAAASSPATVASVVPAPAVKTPVATVATIATEPAPSAPATMGSEVAPAAPAAKAPSTDTVTSSAAGTASTTPSSLSALSSAPASVTTAVAPSSPRNLASTAGDSTITLTWTSVSGATSYNIYRSLVSNGQVVIGSAFTNSYVDSGLSNGITYFYKVTAVSSGGESSRSSEMSNSPIGPPAPPDPATVAAHRLLRQATWGPKPTEVDALKNQGAAAWITAQLAQPPSTYPDTLYTMSVEDVQERFMANALTGPDQLRQRVAFALHKIWVVSGVEIASPAAIVTYHRLLLNDAFGSYRDLMRDITLNPAMGRYLNMLNNRSQAVTGTLPNENYARELMQLFTTGIPRLNPNGTPVVALSGATVVSYTEQDVKELARIFTGWTFGDGSATTIPNGLAAENYKVPMEAVARFHDTGAKTFLNRAFPAGQTARQDLDQALDILFNSPNLPSFVSRQLIQQLVTSNPSPQYVTDVARVFIDNGGGGRGDLSAVVRAILMHPEASQVTASSGKLNEPVLYVLQQLRALNATVADHPFMASRAEAMGQKVLYPGSVFSYFSPGYKVRGTAGPNGPIGGPEFQILTSVTALERANFVAALLGGWFGTDVAVDYTPFTNIATDSTMLVDYCNTLFMGGRMSPEARMEIINAVRVTAASNYTERARTALYLTLTSAQFQVDR